MEFGGLVYEGLVYGAFDVGGVIGDGVGAFDTAMEGAFGEPVDGEIGGAGTSGATGDVLGAGLAGIRGATGALVATGVDGATGADVGG